MRSETWFTTIMPTPVFSERHEWPTARSADKCDLSRKQGSGNNSSTSRCSSYGCAPTAARCSLPRLCVCAWACACVCVILLNSARANAGRTAQTGTSQAASCQPKAPQSSEGSTSLWRRATIHLLTSTTYTLPGCRTSSTGWSGIPDKEENSTLALQRDLVPKVDPWAFSKIARAANEAPACTTRRTLGRSLACIDTTSRLLHAYPQLQVGAARVLQHNIRAALQNRKFQLSIVRCSRAFPGCLRGTDVGCRESAQREAGKMRRLHTTIAAQRKVRRE